MAEAPSQPGTPDAGPSGLDGGSPMPSQTPRSKGAFSAEAILVDASGPGKRKAVGSVQVQGRCKK